MFKKILSISALSVSALLLILSVVDVFVDSVALFELLPLKIAVVLMLLLSLTVTLVACFAGAWRRPLLLLACLLQTPVAGAMAVVWVYGLCFPEVMPLQALFPFLVALTGLASVIQAVVIILGEGMYEDLPAPAASEEDDEDDFAAYADELFGEEEDEDADVTVAAPAARAAATRVAAARVAALSAPVEEEPFEPAPIKPGTMSAPRKAQLTADDLGTAEDDLAPVPRRKRTAADELPDELPIRRKPAEKPQQPKAEFADPFALLKEEADFDEWKKSVKGMFDEKKDEE
ncbi:MAG: hypothetical protein IJW98_08235 [Clostridia bacterium]|nr:hypothetical protein [Clostridia bacterium]